MYSEKISTILSTKSGYYYDDGEAVVIILCDPKTIKKQMASGGGFRLNATAVNKKSGAELSYSLYKNNDPFTLDVLKLKSFRSFGTGATQTFLLDDLKR
jgi:hypothetical protein